MNALKQHLFLCFHAHERKYVTWKGHRTPQKGGGFCGLCADSSQMLWLPKSWQHAVHSQLWFELEALGYAGEAEVVTEVRARCL